jgi:hypothetical protein
MSNVRISKYFIESKNVLPCSEDRVLFPILSQINPVHAISSRQMIEEVGDNHLSYRYEERWVRRNCTKHLQDHEIYQAYVSYFLAEKYCLK